MVQCNPRQKIPIHLCLSQLKHYFHAWLVVTGGSGCAGTGGDDSGGGGHLWRQHHLCHHKNHHQYYQCHCQHQRDHHQVTWACGSGRVTSLWWGNLKKIWQEKDQCYLEAHSGRPSGNMVSVLDSRASAPGSSPGQGHCVVFLGKTLYSHRASLHPGV